MPRMRFAAPLRAGGGPILTALVLAVVLMRGARAAESPFGFDPVRDLRHALQMPVRDVSPNSADLIARGQSLQRCTAALCSPPELREALLLDGWRDGDAAEAVAAVDRAVRLDLARRFERVVCDVLYQGDRAGRLAAANMLSEAAPALQELRLPGWNPSELSNVLAKLVRDGEGEVRGAAARALGRVHADAAVAGAAFQDLSRADDPALRRAALEGLTYLVQGVAQPPGRPSELRQPQGLAEIVPVVRAVLPVLVSGLADPDAQVRALNLEALQQTAQALARRVDGPRLAPNVLAEEADPSAVPGEQERAEWGRLAQDLKDLTARLAPALGDWNPAARLQAHQTVEALSVAWCRLQDQTAQPAVTGATAPAGGPGPTLLPALATQAQPLERYQPNRWLTTLPMLAWGASDPDVRVRRAAVATLEALGPEAAPAAHALVCALADGDVFVRWGAARTLGKLGPVPRLAVVPDLIPLVADPDSDVRLAAVEALRAYGPRAEEAVPALARAVQTGSPALRLAAMQTLEAIGLPAQGAVPALAAALQAPNVHVRLAAARLLSRFGPAALNAQEALQAALHDPDAEVRQTVSDALLRVLPPPGRSPAAGPRDAPVIPTSCSAPPTGRVRDRFAEDRSTPGRF